MKKLVFCLLGLFISAVSCGACQQADCCDARFTGALSAGYVIKHADYVFKEVYGRGMANVITADGCYQFWRCMGVGAKVSYWRANGKTTFFKQCTLLQEVPVTFYLRAITYFRNCLQLYASLGGGVIWMKEKSYLGCVHKNKGIGEFELGMNYPIWCWLNFTSAFRYLFPREKQCCMTGPGFEKIDVGGFDFRAGLVCSFS